MGNRLFVIDIKSSNLKYLIRQLVACSQGSGGKVAHVLEDRGEDADGLLRELLLVPGQQGPQQRQAEGLPRVPPQLLAGGRPRGCRGQELGPLPSRLANCLVCVPDEMINWQICQSTRHREAMAVDHLKCAAAKVSRVCTLSPAPLLLVTVS